MVQARYHTTIPNVALAAEIEEHCETERISEAEFVRRAIKHYVETEVRE